MGACIDVLNDLALGFNKAVKVLMQNLSSRLTGMKYSVGSSYEVVSNIIKDPQALGKDPQFSHFGGKINK